MRYLRARALGPAGGAARASWRGPPPLRGKEASNRARAKGGGGHIYFHFFICWPVLKGLLPKRY